MFVSPQNICLNPTSQCDFRRWSLWEVIRIQWGHKSEASRMGLELFSESWVVWCSLLHSLPRKDTRSCLSVIQMKPLTRSRPWSWNFSFYKGKKKKNIYWLIGKDLDAGKDWRQEEKGMTEDKIVGWHHRLYGHEFEQGLGVGDGQGGLACCSLWGHKESNTTELRM